MRYEIVIAMRDAPHPRIGVVLVILGLASALGAPSSCGQAAPPTTAVARAMGDGGPLESDAGDERTSSAPEGDADRALIAAVCGARACRVASEESAGTDARGHRLAVVKVTFAAPEGRTGKCEPAEHWIVARDGKSIASSKRAVTLPCDASSTDVASDEVRLREGDLERVSAGGSAWRWKRRSVFQASPLRARLEERSTWSTSSPNFEAWSWSWDDFSGSARWFSPRCTRAGLPPAASGSFEEMGDRRPRYEYVPIPAVVIEDAFRSARWRQVHLGKCAALASSTGAHGFLLRGAAGIEDDGYFKVVLSQEGELFIDIKDNKWISASKRRGPSREDRVEIWLGGELPSFQRKCVRGLPPVTSFVVRVADGEVTAGFGKPDPHRIAVERHAQTFRDEYGWVHFKVRLPSQPPSLTVVYRDGDDGKSVDRIFATSKLNSADASSLGAVAVIPRETATCRVKDGSLEPELAGD